MLNPFTLLEKLIYFLRNFFWNYPDLIIGEKSLYKITSSLYKLTVPYSHFFVAIVFLLSSFAFIFSNNNLKLVNAKSLEITEAVIMGVDGQGRVQKINRVNPLLPSNIQLEKDLSELIYEPLIKYEFTQKDAEVYQESINEYLASEVTLLSQGADYQFTLRKDVKWHDGKPFSAKDVIATFDLVATLPEDTNAYVKAIKQLQWEQVNDYAVRICTKTSDSAARCSDTSNKPIFSNFLELISIKILPGHKISDINLNNYNTSSPELYRSPVGTGRYKFESTDDFTVSVSLNEDYYRAFAENKIKKLHFKYFKSLEDSIKALQNGEVHTLASISVEYLQQLGSYNQIKTNKSPVLYNQYWSMYFNLKKDPSGKSIGPEFFSDVNVRQAISYAIDRSEILRNALQNLGEEALGPINAKSSFFTSTAAWKRYNVSKANELLDASGWTKKRGETYRTNSRGDIMKFSLYFVDTYDRYNVARSIQKDLEEVGIQVIIDRKEQPGQDTSDIAPTGWDLKELSEKVLAPKLFDAVIYGVNTFIDPDRYELFHSSQSDHPKLNISSYVGTAETVKPREDRKEGESSLVRLPKVDRLLELSRSFDPEAAKQERKKNYDQVQELIAEDAPVVFLYHPQFIYFTNSNITKVDLSNVSSVEDRFRNIEVWEMN
jgi:peptide/nickel transport system substrate-binding protein